MVRRQLDQPVERERCGRKYNVFGFARRRPKGRRGPPRFGSDSRRFTRAVVPVDDDQAAAGFDRPERLFDESRLVLNAVEGVRHNERTDWVGEDIGQIPGVTVNRYDVVDALPVGKTVEFIE